jgi:hypothetical protein
LTVKTGEKQMAIFEAVRYATEESLRIPIPGSDRCYVISGYANYSANDTKFGGPTSGITGSSTSDDTWVTHQLNMVVGGEWHDVKDVSPIASVAGFWFNDSDETDATGIEILSCRWDTVGVENNSALERIRLKVRIKMCGGGESCVTKISYHLVAIVTVLGSVG